MIETNHGPIEILYEDNHLLVVNKPIGLQVQADASDDQDLQNELKSWIKSTKNKPGKVYLSVVHRLDRPVGGVMVLAKTSKAASRLSEQIRNNTLKKGYLAVLQNSPPAEEGKLRHYLKKNRKTNIVSVVTSKADESKRAALWYRQLQQHDAMVMVAIFLKTGRPHQIRVQFAHEGAPLWGDHKYGGSTSGNPALFSAALELEHPTKKERMWFTAHPAPEYPWSEFELPKPDYWEEVSGSSIESG